MKKGDWVYSYSKGIWQITRIEEVEDIFPENSKEIIVHCKRFLTSSYKKSITAESCSIDFITPLPLTEIEKVNEVIKSKPSWYKEFQDFSDDVSSILNLAFYVSDERRKSILINAISEKCSDLDKGLTDIEILNTLEEELKINNQSSIRNFTAQFISPNSEVKNKKLLYRNLRFLDF